MRKTIRFIYIFSVALVLLLLGLFHFYEQVDETIPRGNTGYEILEDYEFTAYEDSTAPIGVTQEYRWTLTDIPSHDACITFYIIHQEIEVYVGEELIYSLKKADGNFLSQTVGCDWAQAYLYPTDEGKEVRILVRPIYESGLGNTLTIYYGVYSAIRNQIVNNNMPILIISVVAIAVGIMFILFIFLNIKNLEVDRSLAMLGGFSVFAGLWKIADMAAAPFLFEDAQTLSALAIISILMMLTPYLYFMRNQFGKTTHHFWDVLCLICAIASTALILLQLTGIADLRETLLLYHGLIGFSIIVVTILIFRELRLRVITRKLRTTAICCCLCLVGTTIDMLTYYYSGNSGDMTYCLLAFLIYVIAMGYISYKETKALMERGRQAAHYRKLAMHDELTGLYNRAYYADFIQKNDVLRPDCYLIMMDVNDLKKCNDTWGHDHGDELLINASYLVKKAFPNGKCIRLGGDEFCVLLVNSSIQECHDCLNTFDFILEEFNASHPDAFPVNIAYGYASYISKIDFDFNDTMRRADRMMYQMKLSMKTHELEDSQKIHYNVNNQ